MIYAYNSSNTAGHSKKVRPDLVSYHSRCVLTVVMQTTINALTLTFFSVGNIVGTEIFQPKDAPDYIPGKAAIMILLTLQMILALALRSINIRLNAKKRRVLADEARRRGWSDEDIKRERDKSAFLDLTDKQCVKRSTSQLSTHGNVHINGTETCSSRTLHRMTSPLQRAEE